MLGAGGMGEVYRARDSRLQRDVALKILPDAFAPIPIGWRASTRSAGAGRAQSSEHRGDLRARGVGRRAALVLELVEGPTLADRIAQGPIPVDEALAIARQIADALEAAHEQGIVHRDLKPANIKVAARRHGEGARLRPGQGARACTATRRDAHARRRSPARR